MSWGGYIPGSMLREIIEKEELRVFSEINKDELAQDIERILDEELWATEEWNCSCCGTGFSVTVIRESP